MCGIAGYLSLNPERSLDDIQAIIGRMTDAMTHRGPDGRGILIDPATRLALGHRRLAIVDPTPAGHQPMVSHSGRSVLNFNGEIYNAHDLASTRARTSAMRGHCDAESLLEFMEHEGDAAFARLNGMFSIAFYDRRARSVLLGRDRFGQKPLYFASGHDWFAFASELTALLYVPEIEPRIDEDALGEYLLLQYVHAPRSILRDVQKIEPGSYVRLDWTDSKVIPSESFRYASWDPTSLSPRPRPARTSERDHVAELDALIDASVERRLMSDVPVGALLSGGVDSTLIASSMVRVSGAPVATFSMGFEDSDESEHVRAAETARILGTEHHDRVMLPDVSEMLPDVAKALDEPLGDSSCLPTSCLSALVKSHVKVVLTGDGGDELFGGYHRYEMTLREQRSPLWRLRWRMRQGTTWTPADSYCSPRWWMLMPDAIDALLQGGFSKGARDTASDMRRRLRAPAAPLIHRMRSLDATTYMPGAVLAKVDRMTMQHSIEARSPFLDPEIAAFAQTLAPEQCATRGVLKPLLREVLRRRLGPELARLPKRGFGLPAAGWSQESMMSMCDALLLDADARVTSVMEPDALRRWVDHQRQPHVFSVYQVWTLLILELWLRAHLDDRRHVAALDQPLADPDVVVLSRDIYVHSMRESGS